MSVRKTTEAIATKKAIEIADQYIAKFNNLVQTTSQSNVGKVEEVLGPNRFKVKINGEVKEVTYTGFRPISGSGKVIIDGKFAR